MKHQSCKRPLVWLLIAANAIAIYGCATTNRVTLPANEIPVGSSFKIVSVILTDGQLVTFDRNGGRYVERTIDGAPRRVIVGEANSKDVEIDPEKVLEVRFEHEESGGSFAAGFLLGIPVGASLLYLILSGALNSH
ncbi:MAG: hypothetical protein HY961_13805 [Ignavibacteriae bacterium]|nr:hypothetical protein [Ignavibacteriota bacterium]